MNKQLMKMVPVWIPKIIWRLFNKPKDCPENNSTDQLLCFRAVFIGHFCECSDISQVDLTGLRCPKCERMCHHFPNHPACQQLNKPCDYTR